MSIRTSVFIFSQLHYGSVGRNGEVVGIFEWISNFASKCDTGGWQSLPRVDVVVR